MVCRALVLLFVLAPTGIASADEYRFSNIPYGITKVNALKVMASRGFRSTAYDAEGPSMTVRQNFYLAYVLWRFALAIFRLFRGR